MTSVLRPRLAVITMLAIALGLAAPAYCLQPNSFVGTWQANISKSKRHPNHLFKSATLRFEVSGEEILLTYTGVNMSGAEETGTFRIHPDGKAHPIPDAPGYVEVSRWIGDRVLETVASKDGKVAGHSSYEVSEDGKTLTAKISGSDAGGMEFEQIIVCDREEPSGRK